MSDTLYKIKGYLSSSTAIAGALIFVPLKHEELVDSDEWSPPTSGLWLTLSSLLTIISLPASLIYQYDRYFKMDKIPKWIIFGNALVVGLAVGYLGYQRYDQQHNWTKALLSGMATQLSVLYCFFYGIYLVKFMSADCKKASPYLILYTINNFIYLADFLPIDQSLKKQPHIYYPVHAIRAVSFGAEGIALFIEVYNHKKVAETQPSLP
jgi:hypothetical protein